MPDQDLPEARDGGGREVKTVEINVLPARIEFTPEAKALTERVNNPQDLNDAMLSVAVDAHAERLAKLIEAEMVKDWFAEIISRRSAG